MRDDTAIAVNRARAYGPLLGEHRFFSHETAARIWGCPLPTRASIDDPVHVSTMSPHTRPRGRSIIGHEITDASTRVERRYGLPVTDAASTWIACAPSLSLEDLIAVADHLVLNPVYGDPRDPRPWTTIEALGDRAAGFHGRGASIAKRALPFVRTGAESRPETLLRLLIVRSGLPEPAVNVEVYGTGGEFVGRADLLYPGWKVIVEYDGEQHRTSSQQYARDAMRVEGFHRAGYQRIGVRKSDLFVHPTRTIDRVTRALNDAGWRPRRSTRH